MNKIKVVNNEIIPFEFDGVSVCDNSITFTCDGNYIIDYIDCNDVCFDIIINDKISIYLFEYSDNKDIVVNNTYNLNKNSSLIVNKFYYNNSTDEKIKINLNKDKANIKYYFSSISSNKDRYKMDIYHLDKNTNSDIINRTVAKEDSSNYFDINSYVENGIKDTYLNQQTKIITLGDSNNRINPNMFTHDNSTTAIHSSVIGNINEDDIFYLMSRGIDYNNSINLIIKGIILSNINPDMEYREKILNILSELGGE